MHVSSPYLAAESAGLAQGVVKPNSAILADMQELLGYAAGIVFLLCVAKVIFVGARLAWDHKHGAGIESTIAAEFVAANIGAVLAGTVSVTIATILLATAHGPQIEGGYERGNLVEQIEQKQQQRQHVQGENE